MKTQAEPIVEVLAELVPDQGMTLARQHGSQALATAQAIEVELSPHLGGNPTYAPLWQQFQAQPVTMAPALAGVLQVILAADAALARRLDVLLASYRQALSTTTTINTGGGAYIGGDMTVSGGDFVGRDKIHITGDGNVVGDHNSATVIKRTGMTGAEVAALFDRALALARRKPPEVREDLESAVEIAQEETQKGDDADKSLLNKALDVLLDKGPDILELVLDAILNPAAAAGKGARMLAKQARGTLRRKDAETLRR